MDHLLGGSHALFVFLPRCVLDVGGRLEVNPEQIRDVLRLAAGRDNFDTVHARVDELVRSFFSNFQRTGE